MGGSFFVCGKRGSKRPPLICCALPGHSAVPRDSSRIGDATNAYIHVGRINVAPPRGRLIFRLRKMGE